MLTWPRRKALLTQQHASITDKVDSDKWKCGTVKRHNVGGQVIAAKVTLVGNLSAGKTSLALRYCRGSIDAHPKPTVAVDWLHHSEMVNNRRVNLQIWDTAGQEKFEAVMPNFLRSSAAVLLCYDVTDVRSFMSKTKWLEMIRGEVPEALVVLVATKVDKADRIISVQDGEQFARENRLEYIETSAKTGHNVDGLFYEIAARMAGMWMMNYANTDEFNRITIEEDRKDRKTCHC
ncbi:ras-related protein Rab-6A-like [Haliotis asinina]|uniref:ras-related protein Rab-6A-like n=1 Tax=Haliotis asinina TaxID=109174 RepID=UPI0035321381